MDKLMDKLILPIDEKILLCHQKTKTMRQIISIICSIGQNTYNAEYNL